MKKTLQLIVLSSLLFVSCNPDYFATETPVVVEKTYTSGNANFSNYVAMGNSLTAGYSDAALFKEGQENSYPNTLAKQFSLAGGGAFTQPLMNDNLGGLLLNGNQIATTRLFLSFATGSPLPIEKSGTPTTEVTNVLSGPFNNMGVPGAKVYHLLAPGYGNVAGVALGLANPYFARMASSSNTTVLQDAMAENATFFSLWIGNNDILGYALAGGTGVDQTGNLDPSTYASDDISDPNVFAASYNGLLQGLTANGAGGIVANLPDITTIPYFTTVPYAPLDPTNPSFGPQIPTLNATFESLNNVFAFLGVPERQITFSTTGASAVVIKDESLPNLSAQITQVLQGGGLDAPTATILGMLYGQARQATASDLLVLPSSSIIGQLNTDALNYLMSLGVPQATAGQLSVNGVTYPLEDKWVLTPDEQQKVATAQGAYNATIEGLAQQYDLAFFDAKGLLQELNDGGIFENGILTTAVYATGGGFSLDGVHPSPRGIIDNALINLINAKYGSDLPQINVLNFKGLYID